MRIECKKGSYERALSFSTLTLEVSPIGQDVLLAVYGGDVPHIGGVVLAVPRPSLTGDGRTSVTSSVVNITGHKDEAMLRRLGERAAKAWEANVVCTGGFHMDAMTPAAIEEVLRACEETEFV